MKMACQVPRQTHTYFVDHLLSCNHTSVRTDILTRYVKFVKGLQASPSMEVAVMCGVVSGDVRSTTGCNLNEIGWEVGLNPQSISLGRVKEVLGERLSPIAEVEKWRVGYLGKLLQVRGEALYEGGETIQLTSLIDSLCVN